MIKICVIGNAGSGKTTLVSEVFSSLKKMNINTELVSEYIRTDIQLNGPMQSVWEQYRTVGNQRSLEDAVPSNVEVMISDSGTLTPFFYSMLYCDTSDTRQRLVIQDMFKQLTDDLFKRRYDLVFFLPRVETYRANPNILTDGTRYQNEEEITLLESQMNLMFSGPLKFDNVITVDCPLVERANTVLAHITKFKHNIKELTSE